MKWFATIVWAKKSGSSASILFKFQDMGSVMAHRCRLGLADEIVFFLDPHVSALRTALEI